jgi:hypothetical protein
VVFDEKQLATSQANSAASRSAVVIWSGRPVELYDFEFPTNRLDSSQVDGIVIPKYQFHLEVEHIAFPADGDSPESAELVWAPDSFAVDDSKDDAKVESVKGYAVTTDLEQQIRTCLAETLLVDLQKARVLRSRPDPDAHDQPGLPDSHPEHRHRRRPAGKQRHHREQPDHRQRRRPRRRPLSRSNIKSSGVLSVYDTRPLRQGAVYEFGSSAIR